MKPIAAGTRAAWTVAELERDPAWVFTLDDRARQDLTEAVRRARDPDKALFGHRRADFDLGAAAAPIAAAFREVRDGRGIALVRGLPREELSPENSSCSPGPSACTPASRGRRARPATTSRRSRTPAPSIAAPPDAAIPPTPSSTSTPTAPTSSRSPATTRRGPAA